MRAGTSFKMFPPHALILFRFVLFLLCFPLGKLPLSFLALEKRLYLREQDTGQIHNLMPFRYMLHTAHKGNTSPYGQKREYSNDIPGVRIYHRSGDQKPPGLSSRGLLLCFMRRSFCVYFSPISLWISL